MNALYDAAPAVRDNLIEAQRSRKSETCIPVGITLPKRARTIIESLPIRWEVKGENNGKPVRVFEGHGHEDRITFGFDRLWGAVIDQRGELFPEDLEAEALAYAENTIRARLLSRLDAAEKLRTDLAPFISI